MSRISLHPEEKPIAVYRTDFEIEASAEQVWAVLVDFESYADWNPSLPAISGELREGSTVSLTLAMPGRPPLTVKAQLQEVTPTRRLTWHGNVGADWLFAGDRQFAIHPLAEEKVRFTHVEDVHGLLFLVFRVLVGGAIQRHHDTLNSSLENRAEALAAQAAANPNKARERSLR
jgi:hypothetical protein